MPANRHSENQSQSYLTAQEALRADLTAAETRIVGLEAALITARTAIHELCLERQSTEGYRAVFDEINLTLRHV
jgi:hypothetical protein